MKQLSDAIFVLFLFAGLYCSVVVANVVFSPADADPSPFFAKSCASGMR